MLPNTLFATACVSYMRWRFLYQKGFDTTNRYGKETAPTTVA